MSKSGDEQHARIDLSKPPEGERRRCPRCGGPLWPMTRSADPKEKPFGFACPACMGRFAASDRIAGEDDTAELWSGEFKELDSPGDDN
jgi:hypothetical protein